MPSGRPPVDTLDLMITTRCDRRCPDCCCHIGEHAAWDVAPASLPDLGVLVGYIPTLVVTGGEPTLHPRFSVVAARVAASFRFGRLVLATNGGMLRMVSTAALQAFDEVRVSLVPVGPRPPEATLEYLRRAGVHLSVREVEHRQHAPGHAAPCGRAWRTASLLRGLVYPCCVAAGIPGADGVRLTEHWRADIARLPLSCDRCVFAEKGPCEP